MAKDQLARGARSATYGFEGKPGDSVELKNVSTEERDTAADQAAIEAAAAAKPPARRKKFTPLGFQILVRQAEAESRERVYTTQADALKDKSNDLVVVRDEEAKKQDAPAEGFVVAVGNDVKLTKVDDNVVFGKYAGAAFNLNGEWLLLMNESEILGYLSDEDEDIEETDVYIVGA